MSTLFFYGTLRHLPLLEIVLGRPLDHSKIHEGTAQGVAVFAVKNEDFPVIVEDSQQNAEGLLVEGLNETEIARLNFYEGGFDYALRPISVLTQRGADTADIYFPLPDRLEANGPWSLTNWQAQWAELACLVAEEAMQHFGHKTDVELEFMFPSMRARAASKLAAHKEYYALSPSGFTRDDARSEQVITRHIGYFSLEEHKIAHKTFAGGEHSDMHREVFLGSDATILLPYDPKRDRVLLIEQFRAGPWVRQDNTPWMLEPVAGRIDPGESAETCALREAQEEANLTIETLHEVAKVYASPGCNTEFFHIFVGETDLPDDITGVAGLETESEDIKSYLFSFDQLMEMVDRFQAANAPLVLAALWLSRHRERLRGAA